MLHYYFMLLYLNSELYYYALGAMFQLQNTMFFLPELQLLLEPNMLHTAMLFAEFSDAVLDIKKVFLFHGYT